MNFVQLNQYSVMVLVIGLSVLFGNGMSTVMPNGSDQKLGRTASYNNITQLYKHVLNGYDSRVKPRNNQYEAVLVSFVFHIHGITEFNTASQKLSVLGYFYFQWQDEILSWKPEKYGGIEITKFPIHEVWSPTMVFSKDFNGNGVIGDKTDGVIYTSSGYATWTPAGIFSVICDVSTKFYPFDRQSCNISLYADDATASEVSLLPSALGVNTDRYQPNSEWILIGAFVEKEHLGYNGVHFYHIVIELERRIDFIMYTVVSPLILLSVLTIGIFVVPIDSGEKGSIAVTLFLSYDIFVSGIKDDLPHNSVDVSFFLIYIQLLLMFSVFTVLFSFVESWIYSNHADEVVSFCVFNRKRVQDQLEGKSKNEMRTENQNSAIAPAASLGGAYSKVTWRQMLRKIDIAMLLIFICIVSVSTTAFFVSISQRSTI